MAFAWTGFEASFSSITRTMRAADLPSPNGFATSFTDLIQVSTALRAALDAVANQPIDLYEIAQDSGTLYYSTEDITWGGHRYLPYVTSRSSIKRFDGGEFDRVTF